MPMPLPPVEAAAAADGEGSTMAVATMTKPSRKCSCLPRFSAFFPSSSTFSKSEKDAQRNKQLQRKPAPDQSNESSPSRPPLDVALPLTPMEPGLLPPLPLSGHVDKVSLPPIPTSEPVVIPGSKSWSTLRKSQSSTQIASAPRSLSPSARNSSPPSCVVSVPMQRPDSYHSSSESFDPIKKRRSWMPGSKPGSRHTSQDLTQQMRPSAWVATEQTTLDYTSSLNYLKNGSKVTISTQFHPDLDTDLI